MKPENTVKLLLDLDYVRKLQTELPSKRIAILTSLFQFVIGVGLLASLLDNTVKLSFQFIILPLTALSIVIILFSAYTFFGFIIRKRYILLIESLVQRNDNNNENSA